MAMEPLGHVAGTPPPSSASCRRSSAPTIGALIGQAFDGSVTPLAFGFLGVSIIGLFFVLLAERGRLFTTDHHPKPGH